MTSTKDKADYVRSAPNPGGHRCHWPGCGVEVKPAMWGCKRHWFLLPFRLRSRIWRLYRPGQEEAKDPSPEYLGVMREVDQWIAEERKAGRL